MIETQGGESRTPAARGVIKTEGPERGINPVAQGGFVFLSLTWPRANFRLPANVSC